MISLIAAAALALSPNAAPNLPAPFALAAQTDHAQHQGMDHSKHQQAKHDCKACCEKMKGKDGKMECMDKMGEAKPAAPSSEHQGHAH